MTQNIPSKGTKKIGIFLANSRAQMPTLAYDGDVGYDLYALDFIEIPYKQMKEVRTGICLSLPKGVWAQVNTKSSFGKKGLVAHHGVIDSGYTGEITLWISNLATSERIGEPYTIHPGDKVAQLIFHEILPTQIEQVDTLPTTERGEKNCGSSGK